MPVPFVTVDAFTSVKYRGNPAAVVIFPETEGAPDVAGFPSDTVLAEIAQEFNLSETAFVLRAARARGDALEVDAVAEFDLRWFTASGTEVDLCGHATLAAAHALWDTGVAPPTSPLLFHTRSGPLPVVPQVHPRGTPSMD